MRSSAIDIRTCGRLIAREIKFDMKRFAIILEIAILAAFIAIGYMLLYPEPPDLTNDGYTSATFDFRELDDWPAIKASTSDPAVVRALAGAIAEGKNDIDCRCIDLATVALLGQDGKKFVFKVKPAHQVTECQLLIGSTRDAVDRARVLDAVAPLNIPVERWFGP